MDATSGLQYLRARYYDPEDGRFISVDPVPAQPTNIQGINNYVYAVNNPIIFTDPRGESIVGAALIGVGAFALGVGSGLVGQLTGDIIDNMAEMRPVSDWEYGDLATYWASGLSGGLGGGIGVLNKWAGKIIGSGSKPFLKDYLEDGDFDDPWGDLKESGTKATLSVVSTYLMEFTGMEEGIKALSNSKITQKLLSKIYSITFFKKPLEYLYNALLPDKQYPSLGWGVGGSGGGSWGGSSWGYSSSGGGSWGTPQSGNK
jgi:RHS repeat-associated protein